VLTGLGIFFILVVLGAATGAGKDGRDAQDSAAATQASGAPDGAAAEAEDEAAADAEAAAKSEADRRAAEQEAEADRAAAEARAAEEAAKENPASYEAIGSRDYALIAKDPDAHVGERYVIYGRVTQLDSATGPNAFLASTDGEAHIEWYEYETNTLVVTDDAAILAPVVEDDLVKMYVEVMGSFSYETQIGGNTTVPQVTVRMIEVTGSAE
jgi:hypothetical protein